MTCRPCTTDLEHCHATLVRHDGGWAECADHECRAPAHAHDLAVDCGEVGCDCARALTAA